MASPTTRIDLGLALLSVLRKPGVKFTSREIAAWCDCTPRYIGVVEARALKKLRAAVRRGESTLSEELAPEAPKRAKMTERDWVPVPRPVDKPKEISYKAWVMEEAARLGISTRAMYQRVYRHPEIRPPVRRINATRLMVRLAAA